MTDVEGAKKKRASDELSAVSLSLKMHKRDLDNAYRQSYEWNKIWMNSMKKQKEMIEGFEAQIQVPKSILREYQKFAANERDLRKEAKEVL